MFTRYGNNKVSVLANPIVNITRLAAKQMETYIAKWDEEIGWLGTVVREWDAEKRRNVYTIKECFLFEQETHAATTEIQQEHVDKFIMDLVTNDPENFDNIINNLKMWGHSHVNMSPSPSGQDDDTAKFFTTNTENDFFIRIIANKKGELRCDVYDLTFGIVFEAVEVTVEPVKPTLIINETEFNKKQAFVLSKEQSCNLADITVSLVKNENGTMTIINSEQGWAIRDVQFSDVTPVKDGLVDSIADEIKAKVKKFSLRKPTVYRGGVAYTGGRTSTTLTPTQNITRGTTNTDKRTNVKACAEAVFEAGLCGALSNLDVRTKGTGKFLSYYRLAPNTIDSTMVPRLSELHGLRIASLEDTFSKQEKLIIAHTVYNMQKTMEFIQAKRTLVGNKEVAKLSDVTDWYEHLSPAYYSEALGWLVEELYSIDDEAFAYVNWGEIKKLYEQQEDITYDDLYNMYDASLSKDGLGAPLVMKYEGANDVVEEFAYNPEHSGHTEELYTTICNEIAVAFELMVAEKTAIGNYTADSTLAEPVSRWIEDDFSGIDLFTIAHDVYDWYTADELYELYVLDGVDGIIAEYGMYHTDNDLELIIEAAQLSAHGINGSRR